MDKCWSSLSIVFCVWLLLLTSSLRIGCLVLDPEDFPPMRKCRFSESLIVSHFTFTSPIHFEYILLALDLFSSPFAHFLR